jgi:hypothetical protein
MLYYWLVQYLRRPTIVDKATQSDYTIRAEEGKLLVHDQAIIDNWQLYHKSTHVEPKPGMVSTAMRAISKKGLVQKRKPGSKERIRYREVDIERLFTWADKNNYGDIEQMKKTLNREPEQRGKNVKDMPTGEEREQRLRERLKRENRDAL